MPLNISYVFTSGTVIEASEMNSNFTGVKNFVDALATGVNIDSGAITAAKIATGAVETAKIADNAVTAAKIATGAVETAKIADNAVTIAKLGTEVSQDDQFVLGAQVFG